MASKYQPVTDVRQQLCIDLDSFTDSGINKMNACINQSQLQLQNEAMRSTITEKQAGSMN
jgi:hypothetical protein